MTANPTSKATLNAIGYEFYNPAIKLSILALINLLASRSLSSYLGNNISGKVYSATKEFSLVYLAGVYYGILNDMFAVNYSVKYFAEGHNFGQTFMNTYDKFANAFVWGHLATADLAKFAGIIFGTTALALNLCNVPQQEYLAPVLFGASTIVALGAELMIRNSYLEALTHGKKDMNVWCWYSCSDRNSFGYETLPLLALVGLICYAATRCYYYYKTKQNVEETQKQNVEEKPILSSKQKLTLGIQVASLLFLVLGDQYVRRHDNGLGISLNAYYGRSGHQKG